MGPVEAEGFGAGTHGIQVAVTSADVVGESPVWDEERQELIRIDMPLGLVHTTFMPSGRTSTVRVPTYLGAVALRSLGGLVVACEQGFGTLDGDDFALRSTVLGPGYRMNDAQCDAVGRLWAGSTAFDFSPGHGALHVLQPDWQHQVVLTDLTLPNGIGWSPDSTSMYVADSLERLIRVYDYDLATGTLSRERVLISFGEDAGLPDGLCVDVSGSLWVAMWGGGQVLQISPRGEVQAALALPVRQPSSCVFGGERLDVLYVTSATDGLGLPAGSKGDDGSVFAIHGTGAQGRPVARFGPELKAVERGATRGDSGGQRGST